MYEDKEVSTNWIKIGLRIVSVILIALILFKIVDIVGNNRTNVVEEDKMKEKIALLESAGKKHFTDEFLPKETGDSKTVTLQELIDKELIEEIKDTKDRVCNLNDSNVKVFKLDSEYQFKSTLICDDYENYLNSFVEIEKGENVNTDVTIKPEEETTTTAVVKTTKRKTTAKKKYTVSFNTNGGSFINDQMINANDSARSPGAPKRIGYTFVGWYYHGESFSFSTKINQDYVLIAKWIKN